MQATRPINAKASQVNGLDFEMLQAGVKMCQLDSISTAACELKTSAQAAASKQAAIRRFMNFIGDEKTALIAHNAAFDLRTQPLF